MFVLGLFVLLFIFMLLGLLFCSYVLFQVWLDLKGYRNKVELRITEVQNFLGVWGNS